MRIKLKDDKTFEMEGSVYEAALISTACEMAALELTRLGKHDRAAEMMNLSVVIDAQMGEELSDD